MNCFKCSGSTAVTNTVSDGEKVYRQRTCKVCGYEFYTTEAQADCKYILTKIRDDKRKERLKVSKQRNHE